MRRLIPLALTLAALGGCCINAAAPLRPLSDRCPVGISADPAPAGTRAIAVRRVQCQGESDRACLAKLGRSACEAGGNAVYDVRTEASPAGVALVGTVGVATHG
ncbi:MAG: hypothetical protein ACYCWW_06310 [Deltaproteobacteria bacterium]